MTVADPRSPGAGPSLGNCLEWSGIPLGCGIRMLARERDRTFRCYRQRAAREKYASMGKSQEMLIQDIPADTKNRAPSSRVLQEVIRQAPAEYVTVGWLTSTLQRHSFGIIMLCLGLLATTPVGSSVPGFVLGLLAAQLILGRTEPVFPRFIMTRRLPTTQLTRLGCRAIHFWSILRKQFIHAGL